MREMMSFGLPGKIWLEEWQLKDTKIKRKSILFETQEFDTYQITILYFSVISEWTSLKKLKNS